MINVNKFIVNREIILTINKKLNIKCLTYPKYLIKIRNKNIKNK